MGDHVKVIAGRYENDTGLIVRVEDNTVVLFSDLTMHEVLLLLLLLLQNLYSAQIQACLSRRRWCRWVGKWISRGGYSSLCHLCQLPQQTRVCMLDSRRETSAKSVSADGG